MSQMYPPMILSDGSVENRNVAWRVEPGEKDSANPLIVPKFPWDEEAWLTTPPTDSGGRTPYINARTRDQGKGGAVKSEATRQ
jgi:hypothetical protein